MTSAVHLAQVRLPCDVSESWPVVRKALEDARLCLNEQKCYEGFGFLWTAVQHRGGPSRPRTTTVFKGLLDFINCSASKEEKKHFTTQTLPYIIDCVLSMPACKPEEGLRYSFQGASDEQALPWDFVTSLVAAAFLCLLPPHRTVDLERFSENGYELFFHSLSTGPARAAEAAAEAKLRMVLNFFDCMAARSTPAASIDGKSVATAVAEDPIVYKRVVHRKPRTLDQWYASAAPLCKFVVPAPDSIIEDFSDCLQVDFANEYIGGGVLQSGIVQEEIMFSTSPQLQAAMFFMAKMAKNEAIQIHNFERFSDYTGYAGTLRFAGSSKDRSKLHVTAIDAEQYFDNTNRQYTEECLLRDLNKACVGFSQDSADDDNRACATKLPIVTGNWGCGVFRADPQLKSMLQWIAASTCSSPSITYCTFGSKALTELEAVIQKAMEQKKTAGTFLKAVVEQSKEVHRQMLAHKQPCQALFELLLESL